MSCFNPLFRLFLPLKQQITGSLVYGSCTALKNTIFYCPEPSITQKNTVKKQDFSYKKMPKNCRLSFCLNLILTQQTSIFIIKFEHFRAYLELCKKIAMSGNPAGTCRLWVGKIFPSGLEDQKRAGSKNFWRNLGKGLGPLSGHPRKFLIHAQSWLKSAGDFPLNRKIKCPKKPPLGSKRVFFKSGYLGVMYCPP